MNIKFPDYNNCLVNLTNSLLKQYGAELNHTTLNELDEYLNFNSYKNVVLLLYDGLGSNLLKRNLGEKSFLSEHIVKDITSVFPSTTTASTTTILSGLNPAEHCWLGWDIYVASLDKTVTMYWNVIKGTEIQASNEHVANKEFAYKSIFDKIKETGNAKAYCISPFGGIQYDQNTPDEMYDKILELCNNDERKFIYAYSAEPDSLMHELGTFDEKVIQKMQYIDRKTEEFCNKLKDTLVIVTADHGHIDAECIVLEDYPSLQNMLIRETSLEPRATNFFVQDGLLEDFKIEFSRLFEKDFLLLSKEEVIEKRLFGDGQPNAKFYSCLGDFLAIAISNKAFIDKHQDFKNMGLHAGITEDEVIVPLIIIDKK